LGAFALACLGIVLAFLGGWPEVEPAPYRLSATATPATPAQQSRKAVEPLFVPERPAPRTAVAMADWGRLQAGMHDSNPYAAYMALKEERKPGSYAHAWRLKRDCWFVAVSADVVEYSGFDSFKPGDHVFANRPELMAARQQAAQVARSRCDVLSDGDWTERPYPDDVNGLRFEEAMNRLDPRAMAFPRAELQVLAAQGALYELSQYLSADADGPTRYFEGQRIANTREGRDAYNYALSLATVYANNGAGRPGEGISQLLLCIDYGRCNAGRPEDYLLASLPSDSPVRAHAMALYPRILAAFARGDVEAFAPPPQSDASPTRH